MFARRMAMTAGLICLIIGLSTILLWSLELLHPNLQIADRDVPEGNFLPPSLYTLSKMPNFHLSGMMIGLPMSVFIGICASQLAARTAQKIAILASAIALFSPVLPVLPGMVPSAWDLYPVNRLMQIALASLSACGVVSLVCFVLRRQFRFVSVMYAGAALLPLALSVLLYDIVQRSTNYVLRDTQFDVAQSHSLFLAMSLLMFSVMSGLGNSRSRTLERILAGLHIGAILVTGYFWISALSMLGIEGMPRGYADYPEQFSGYMSQSVVYSLCVMALVFIGYVCWMVSGWSHRAEKDERAEAF